MRAQSPKSTHEVADPLTELVDLFQTGAFKEEPVTTEGNSVGVRSFSCAEFGKIPTVKKVLDVIRGGEFLNSPNTEKSAANKLSLSVGNLGEDQIWVTNATITDLHRQCDFYIIDHKGDLISFNKKSIKQPESTQPEGNNPSQDEDNIRFLESIAPVIYTKENKAYAPKFFNLIGKYFHQGGIGVFINTYLCELGVDKSLVVTGKSSNDKVIFDLTRLNQGIIKITEQFEFNAARNSSNPEEVFKREDNKPIAAFTFSFTVQFNPLNDECIIEPLPLKMDIMDVKLMSETYMPSLNNVANFTPSAILGHINSTVSTVINLISGRSYSSLLFNQPDKKSDPINLSTDGKTDPNHSDDESSKSDSSKGASSNGGSPVSSTSSNNSSGNSPSSS